MADIITPGFVAALIEVTRNLSLGGQEKMT